MQIVRVIVVQPLEEIYVRHFEGSRLKDCRWPNEKRMLNWRNELPSRKYGKVWYLENMRSQDW